jgi:hypothetical protein
MGRTRFAGFRRERGTGWRKHELTGTVVRFAVVQPHDGGGGSLALDSAE